MKRENKREKEFQQSRRNENGREVERSARKIPFSRSSGELQESFGRVSEGRVIYIEEREDAFRVTIAVCGGQVPDKQSLERVIQALHADRERETTS